MNESGAIASPLPMSKTPSKNTPSFLIRMAMGFGRVVALVGALVLAVPVILSPIATSVPAPLWVVFMLMDFALLVMLFQLKPVWVGVMGALCGVGMVSVIAIAASQWFASTPPITNASGQAIPGAIATLEKVELNGSEQWISIRGNDVNKPVLLFLAGGPGGSQLVTARRALAQLEEYFVVVNWEQPGAGKSFNIGP